MENKKQIFPFNTREEDENGKQLNQQRRLDETSSPLSSQFQVEFAVFNQIFCFIIYTRKKGAAGKS